MSMQSVLTALRVLEEVSACQPAGLSDLSRRLNLPKSTVQRCLRTLAEAGWLRSEERELTRWMLTPRAFSLGSLVLDDRNLRDIAMKHLSELQAATLEAVHLTVPDGDEVVLVERLDSAHHLRTFQPIGRRMPLHASSNGKAFLASLSDQEIERYLAQPLAQVTANTITEVAVLREQLAEIRLRGYAENHEELNNGVFAVGAAICPADGRSVGALSVSAPALRMTAELMRQYGELVHAAAAAIAADLPKRLRG